MLNRHNSCRYPAAVPGTEAESCNQLSAVAETDAQLLRTLATLCCVEECLVQLQEVHTHTHTHPFNGPFSGTAWVSQYQKVDFTEARDSEWQWHQLGHMQVCNSLQTDNHASHHYYEVTATE